MIYMEQMKSVDPRQKKQGEALKKWRQSKNKSPLSDVFEAHAEVDDAHVPGLEQIK